MAAPMVARMAGPRELTGKAASPGRALGPAFRAPAPAALPAPAGEDARAALAAALARAVEELRGLAAGADPQSAAVLDFQIEMLLDPEMVEPALRRLAAGDGAALAWAGAMDAHIRTLAADAVPAATNPAGEDAFAARAADLADLKQRVLDGLAGRSRADFPEAAIYVGEDMPPSVFLAHDWSKGGGIALAAGSTVSHVAMLARARGVPMVIGLGTLAVEEGEWLRVDGEAGLVLRGQIAGDEGAIRPDPPAADAPNASPPAGSGPLLSLSPAGRGSKGSVPPDAPSPGPSADRPAGPSIPFRLEANINSLADLDAVDPASIDGIGLVRTEFLFLSAAEALSEERHVESYRRILARVPGRPVRLRLLDLGGDKALPGLVEGGPGSLLGERGIRFLLAHPDLARLQARAILRVAAEGEVGVLLPMVTLPQEVAAVARLFEEEAVALARLGVPVRCPPLGIMVEVPATALTLDLFADAAFFSVGTNDLMQYLSAAARDNPAVAPLNAGSETALFRLLAQISAAARSLGKPVAICGDLAGDPEAVARLVALGFGDFSVAPSRLSALRALACPPVPVEG
ncbi:putative PEP-binding protein [Ancylobacter oerskovii]|uniref:Phosphoenolpyruvate-protein phosphotransferase n=2 Tax=Ancylobacter oerskovii TaxID=459519 RepID=A0ABW4YTC9_9HYPH